jgi:hypothetical protein
MRFTWLAPLVFLISCSSQPPAPAMPPFQATVSMHDLMNNVLDPAADEIWESVGTVITVEGTFEKAPASDDEWAGLKGSAMRLAESGNLLLLPSRSGGNPDWIKYSLAMIEQSNRALKAAEAKDKDAIFTIGGDIYDACTNCHKQFDQAITSAK